MHPHPHHHEEDYEENAPFRRGRRRQRVVARGRGPFWFGPPWEGPGEGFPPGPPPWVRARFAGGGRGRARRGDVRSATLALLSERPMHGYEIISELSQRTEGLWQPSPGSIYPTLQLLEDEGLVQAEAAGEGSRRRFSLTDEGRRAATEVTAAPPPWEQFRAPAGARALRHAARSLFAAVGQVAMTGSPEDNEEAVRILLETRRSLYSLLAQPAPEPAAKPNGGGPKA